MADLALSFRQPRIIRLQPSFRLAARFRLLRRNLRHELFCVGKDDRTLDDIGVSRVARYDWLSALMRR